jgi:hypothetical protein
MPNLRVKPPALLNRGIIRASSRRGLRAGRWAILMLHLVSKQHCVSADVRRRRSQGTESSLG